MNRNMSNLSFFQTLLAVCLLFSNTNAQNLLRNQGFEQRGVNVLQNKPDGEGQIDKSQYWKNFGNSSDWYSTNSFNLCFDPSCNAAGFCQNTVLPAMTSHTDEHYAGFGFCEGIQQKLQRTTSNALVRLDFWWSARDCMGNTNIRAYLLKNHAPFKGVPSDCSNPSIGQNISIATVFVNTGGTNPEHIPGVWYHFVSDWVAVGDYDWLLIKGENKPGPGTLNEESYIYIDDVTLLNQEECCLEEMRYESTDDLPDVTHVEDIILAGTDVGIPNMDGPVIVQSNQERAFRAGDHIDLLPGFEAVLGSEFEARIQPCNNTTNPNAGGDIEIVSMNNFMYPDGTDEEVALMCSQKNATHYEVGIEAKSNKITFHRASGEITSNPFQLWDGQCDFHGDQGDHCTNNEPEWPEYICNVDFVVKLTLSNCDQELVTHRQVGVFCNGNAKLTNEDGESQQGNSENPVYINDSDTTTSLYLANSNEEIEDLDYLRPVVVIFPNPNMGTFNVEITNSTDVYFQLKVFHINGSIVHEEDVFTNSSGKLSKELNLIDMSPGVYYVKVDGINSTTVHKLVIY